MNSPDGSPYNRISHFDLLSPYSEIDRRLVDGDSTLQRGYFIGKFYQILQLSVIPFRQTPLIIGRMV